MYRKSFRKTKKPCKPLKNLTVNDILYISLQGFDKISTNYIFTIKYYK